MISLGIDTGGTYTDAVLVDPRGIVIASAKSLTTHGQLILGIRDVLDQLISSLGQDFEARSIAVVSLSTTLATNAIVESQGSRAGLILVGTDAELVTRGGLSQALASDPCIHLEGGHDASGNERKPLCLDPLEPWLESHVHELSAFAVCAEFGIMNPAHEIAVRARLRQSTTSPVTCAHELSARLNAPRRALTALLNARLLSRITELMDAVESALSEREIPARLMVVKGDGSLLDVSVARERPVETILSGPAASVVGAAHLARHADVFVADIGGTTTDIAVLRNGRPRLDPMGASVGGFRTLVNAAAVHSVGLGGDSAVGIGADNRLRVGPRRIMPICRLAASNPGVLAELKQLAAAAAPELSDLRFVWRAPEATQAKLRILKDEQALWNRLDHTPRAAGSVAPDRFSAGLLDRLLSRGLVLQSGLTPTDAAHALGAHTVWSRDAARGLLAAWQRARQARSGIAAGDVDTLAEEVLDCLALNIGLALLDAAYEAEPLTDVDAVSWRASQALLRHALQGTARPAGAMFQLRASLGLPLVAVGASAHTHFPRVRKHLHFNLQVPEHAEVTNALGAVVGVVLQQVERRITSPGPGLFRVHGDIAQRDFSDLESALAAAEAQTRSTARMAAKRSGADECEVTIDIHRNEATLAPGESIFIEAIVRAVARGRPAYAR